MTILDNDKIRENRIPLMVIFIFFLSLLVVETLTKKIEDDKTELSNQSITINKLVINEIMTSNKGSYVSELGEEYDWIELYNGSNKDINLSKYSLSDDESERNEWIFPDVTINSKEYMIIYLSSSDAEGLYANFAINKNGGETLTLKTANGKTVDSVNIKAIEKNTVMARSGTREWTLTDEITPGYSNNEKGRKEYLESRYEQSSDLVINEVLTNNKGNLIVDNQLYEYIEVKNISKEDINLKDYYLSDDINRPYLWKLPNKILKEGEVYLFYTTGLDDEYNTSFTLASKTGQILLSKKNKIIDQIEYKDQSGGYALIRTLNNDFIEGTNISPGYNNDSEGRIKYLQNHNENKKELIINEVMSSNNKYLAQNNGIYYDWIELYNNSGKTINLNEYTITTDKNTKAMYKFGKKELKAGEYYILMASGNVSASNSKYKHANFRISPTESLYLYKNGELIDSIFITNIPIEYSYGRNSKNGYYYIKIPTPGSKNKDGIAEISPTPTMSLEPGIYNNIEKLNIELKGSGTIYYTLDGSTPTNKSNVYKSAITLSKTTVIRAVSYEGKKKESEIVTGTYIINEKHTMPVFAITTPKDKFKAVSNSGYGDLTVKAHAELYEDGKSFSIDCGLKLFGGESRLTLPKKSFSLKFNTKYGPSELDYKVFDNREAVTYETLVLRSGSQDSINSMMRDELVTSIMDDYGTVDVQAYKPVVLYINGEYWGIYFLREKIDEEFIEHHYDVSSEGVNIVRIDGKLSAGNNQFYRNLLNYINSHDMSIKSNYEYVKTKLDIDNFIDFWIAEMYTNNIDMRNQRFFNHSKIEKGKIKMIFYDLDFAFYGYVPNYFNWMLNPEGLGEWKLNNKILINLMNNAEFKNRFLERLSYNLKNVWNETNVMNRYNELYKILEPEMPRNQERWGNTMKNWYYQCEILKNYIKKRQSNLLAQIKNYYGLTSAEMNKYFYK
jgi:CotH protein.